MSISQVKNLLSLPNGARFYKCALQVNPNDYAAYRGGSPNPDAEDYAKKLVQQAHESGIEVLAVTHHHHVDFVDVIRPVATAAGITVFPGFELTSQEGVHVLCIYGPSTEMSQLKLFLGNFGLTNAASHSEPCSMTFRTILETVQKKQGGIAISAHAPSDAGGLFKVLQKTARINAWRDENLLAIQIAKSLGELQQDIRKIVENKEPAYKREVMRGRNLAVAVLNAKDIEKPADLANPAATTWIKMAELSIEGLKQAFLDPDSRIRLNTEEIPAQHICLEAIEWEGGFLDGVRIHFNENLNVLIGGRGAGKSTMIESIRHVLGKRPSAEEAERNFRSLVRDVIGSNTTIRLLVNSPRPSPRRYWIVRNGANPPDVRDADTGEVMSLDPGFVVGNLDIYGQHELSELSQQSVKQRKLLERFSLDVDGTEKLKIQLRRKLKESRERIGRLLHDSEQLDERLAEQPRLEETLKRYRDLGVEGKLKERSALVREERVLDTARERLLPLEEAVGVLRDCFPDTTFLSDAALKDLAGKEILTKLREPLDGVEKAITSHVEQLTQIYVKAKAGIEQVALEWKEKREDPVKKECESILKDLNRESVDGDEFIALQKQLEGLKPLKERRAQMAKTLEENRRERAKLLSEWADTRMADRRSWEGVAKRVSVKLDGSVRVTMGEEDRASLAELLRTQVEGNYTKPLQNLVSDADLSSKALADTIRQGKGALLSAYSYLTDVTADRLVSAGDRLAMLIEEEDWVQLPQIELNLGTADKPNFSPLQRLSTGQKATALLCLLLLESDAPLIVDQPEDDLDNRFISEYIVPKMKDEKRRRQFIFSSHNANIPVLGDAELVVGLSPVVDPVSGELSGNVTDEHRGAIDNTPVRELMEEILEGGKDAFFVRRAKYGF